MNKEEIELIDGFFNKSWCCDLDEVYKAVMKLQNNWNELKKWLEEDLKEVYRDAGYRHNMVRELLDKMQELEGNNE